MLILGLETSCDETAAAVVKNGTALISNVVSSQISVHSSYGGVVPELASRHHLKNIIPVIQHCLDEAGLTLDDIHAVAVAYGPGLIGSLLVGVSAAKAIAFARSIPLVPINHLEAHLAAVLLENRGVEFPAVSLVVSGGHTTLLVQEDLSRFRKIGATRDDAAGEAYDKVAKLLGMGYPGGPIIDRLAPKGDDRAVPLSRPKISDGSPDFSFSGIKSAVVRYVKDHGIKPLGSRDENPPQEILDLLASFQRAVVESLVYTTEQALNMSEPRSLLVAGGVAANSLLRAKMEELADKYAIRAYFPSGALSTDNGAMIASLGYYKVIEGRTCGMELDAVSRLPIPTVDDGPAGDDS
ncbi:tRNA (adenosine(37)-N6)-threonylcarbamoyltransferase complex transferase subunit TsaD [Acidobacteriota bacterium]